MKAYRQGLPYTIVLAVAFGLMGAFYSRLTAEEPKVGTLTGLVVADENDRPIVHAEVNINSRRGGYHEHVETDARGRFRVHEIPIGDFAVEANGKAHRTRQPVHVEVQEGKSNQIELRLPSVSPYLHVRIRNRSFLPGEKIRCSCEGLVEGAELKLHLFRIDDRSMLREVMNPRYEYDNESGRSREAFSGKLREVAMHPTDTHELPNGVTLVRSWVEKIHSKDSEGLFRQKLALDKSPGSFGLPEGAYVVVANAQRPPTQEPPASSGDPSALLRTGARLTTRHSPPRTAGSATTYESFTVTRLGVITKNTPSQMLVYAMDLQNNRPWSGVKVGGDAATGVTGDDGTAVVRLKLSEQSSQKFVLASHEGSFASVTPYVSGRNDGAGDENLYFYTDRPIYRPGHKVRFKGIVRDLQEGRLIVPPPRSARVEVKSPQDLTLYSKTLRTNRFGSFFDSFDLPEDADLGMYNVTIQTGGRRSYQSVEVAEYRKPEYEVTVTTDRARYLNGDTIRIKANARYYFGSPVANAQVQWHAFSEPRWYAESEEDSFFYEEIDKQRGMRAYGYGEMVAEGKAQTDAEGNVVFDVPAQLAKKDKDTPFEAEADRQFNIDVTVTDLSRKPANGSANCLVTRGEFRLELSTKKWVYEPGDKAALEIVARDYDNKPVPDVSIQLFKPIRWLGDYSEKHRRPLRGSVMLQTDKNGKAEYRFDAGEVGDYLIDVESRDRRGNVIKGSNSVWVARGSFVAPEFKYPDLELVLDKKIYMEGDEAKLLLNTRVDEAHALLTIEGSDIYDHRIVKLKKGSNVITIPVKPEYVPNVFVSVAIARKKLFVERDVPLKVSPRNRVLQVTIESDQEKYEPQETATYKVTTCDASGKPVPAEVSLGVVDESIYALRGEDPKQMIRHYYAARTNRVQTDHSFPEIYLGDGGDDKELGKPIRKEFPDTAFWKANIVTDANGEATVKVRIPDTLGQWRATAKAITLDTDVGATLQKVICRKQLMVRLETPRFFTQKDTCTVAVVVHNESDGAGNFAVTLSALGGSARLLPSDGSAKGGSAGASPSLSVAGKRRFDIELGSGKSSRVDFTVNANGIGDARIVASAEGNGLHDAMQLDIPVLAHGNEVVKSFSGVSLGNAEKQVVVPDEAVLETATLKISITPSVAATVLGSLTYLAQYPWGCVEQTTSSFIPDVYLHRALRQLGAASGRTRRDAELERKLPKMVKSGLHRLFDMQTDDGGWGWVKHDPFDPWMTAYVMFGLTQAKHAGFEVPPHQYERGLRALEKAIKEETWPDQLAFEFYCGELAGAKSDTLRAAEEKLTGEFAKKLGAYSKACVIVGLAHRGEKVQAAALLSELMKSAKATDQGTYWEFQNGEFYREYRSNVEVTALCLTALLTINPDHEKIPDIIEWLLLQREFDHWTSTRDSAAVIYALTDHLVHTRELGASCTGEVIVNGAVVRTFASEANLFPLPPAPAKHPSDLPRAGARSRVVRLSAGEGSSNESPPSPASGRGAGGEGLTITVPASQLRRGANLVTVRVDNPSEASPHPVYFSGALEYFTHGEVEKPQSDGMKITRRISHTKTAQNPNTGAINIESTITAPQAKSGELLRVEVTVETKTPAQRLIIIDRLPSGCEVVERTPDSREEWHYFYGDRVVHDQSVAFFVHYLEAGKHTFTYYVRPEIPGDYHVMPTVGYAMYKPAFRGNSAETRLKVVD